VFDLLTRRNAPLIQDLPKKGIYTLVIFLSKETCLNVGKLGEQRFLKGHYTYTGSALGKGASSLKHRISRHIRKEKRNFCRLMTKNGVSGLPVINNLGKLVGIVTKSDLTEAVASLKK